MGKTLKLQNDYTFFTREMKEAYKTLVNVYVQGGEFEELTKALNSQGLSGYEKLAVWKEFTNDLVGSENMLDTGFETQGESI